MYICMELCGAVISASNSQSRDVGSTHLLMFVRIESVRSLYVAPVHFAVRIRCGTLWWVCVHEILFCVLFITCLNAY